MILLLKIVLAHLIGDFILQPHSWVKHKEAKKWFSGYLYLHAFTHFVLILIITWNPYLWPQALVIAVFHLFIDGIKLQFQKPNNKRLWFFIDQLAHLLVIAGIWFASVANILHTHLQWTHLHWYIATGIVFLTTPTSVIIKVLMSKWTHYTGDHDSESLPDAGQYIGILERLFIFLFILLGEWQAIGFLLAAKSIFRFGDLTRAKDRKLTEYILIGTLLSFAIATLAGLLVAYSPAYTS